MKSDMISILPQYVRVKDYVNIVKLLREKPSLLTTHQEEILETQEELLRIILRNDIRFLLCNRKPIDNIKIELSSMLGTDFHDEIGDIVRENLVERFFNRFKKDIYAMHKREVGLENLEDLISLFEENFQRINFVTSKFPEKWNIKGEFVFRICLLFREIIKKDLNENQNNRKTIIKSINQIVSFEKTYPQRYFIMNCCRLKTSSRPRAIYFDQDDVQFSGRGEIKTNIVLYDPQVLIKTTCKHKKMLSRLFNNYLNIYLESLLSKTPNVHQESVELKVIKAFIIYFQQLAHVLSKIQYFDESTVFNEFVRISSEKLTKMLESIQPKNRLDEVLITLNTLSFAENTFKDLLMRIIDKCDCSFENLPFFHTKRKLEKRESRIFERIIRNDIFSSGLSVKFSKEIMNILSQRIIPIGFNDLCEDMQFFVLESIFSRLFSFIMGHKFTTSLAADFLFEISEIKKFIRKKYSIPMIAVIEKYLKIFLCDPANTECFVDNYFLHSESLFSFSQILTMLKNQKYQSQLFVAYKKKSAMIQSLKT